MKQTLLILLLTFSPVTFAIDFGPNGSRVLYSYLNDIAHFEECSMGKCSLDIELVTCNGTEEAGHCVISEFNKAGNAESRVHELAPNSSGTMISLLKFLTSKGFEACKVHEDDFDTCLIKDLACKKELNGYTMEYSCISQEK